MSLITYDLLLADKSADGSIRNYLNRESIPSLIILRQVEQWIWQRLRIRQMRRKSSNTTIAQGDLSVAYEDSLVYAEAMSLVTPYDMRLESREFEDVQGYWSRDENGVISDGTPSMYTIADQLYFDCRADQAYTYELWGYFALAPLTQANPTNFLTTNLLMVLMNAVTGFAAIYDKQNEVAKTYLALAHDEINTLNSNQRMMQRGSAITTDVP